MMFKSFIDRFPAVMTLDFMLKESVEDYTVEFCGKERGVYTTEPCKVVCFYDPDDVALGVIYISDDGAHCYVDDERSQRYGEWDRDDYTGFFSFMMEDHPVIAEYLLWNL